MNTPNTPSSTNKGSRKVLLALSVLAVLVLAAALGSLMTRPEKAPDVAYTALTGQTHHSSQWRGRVVLVNFWATSCGSCVAEMPDLIATHEKFKQQGFETVAVAMQYDPPAYVAGFVETRKLPFTVAIDHTGSIARAFGDVRVTPTTLLINPKGEVIKRYVGKPDFAQVHTLIASMVKER
jgi:peroxiredoxin